MNAIALDPSLRSFGTYSVRDGQEFSEVKRVPSTVDRIETLGKIGYWMARVSAPDQLWDLCIVEGYSMGSKSSSVTVQAEVGGIVRFLFAGRKVPIIEVPPQVWKSTTGIRLGKGTRFHKSEYLNAVAKLYGKRFDTTDEADAFLLYTCVKKCGTETAIGPGAIKIRQQLEDLKIDARCM